MTPVSRALCAADMLQTTTQTTPVRANNKIIDRRGPGHPRMQYGLTTPLVASFLSQRGRPRPSACEPRSADVDVLYAPSRSESAAQLLLVRPRPVSCSDPPAS